MSNKRIIQKALKIKSAIIVLMAVSTFGAFATLGDGKKKPASKAKPILSYKKTLSLNGGSFTLKTGYNYKANHLSTAQAKVSIINLNTVVTYQKGNATYMIPVKNKVLLDKVKFGIGVRSYNKF
jgi:hypothetical protein